MADRIDIRPDICNGRPVIAGTRIPVQTIMEFLGAGDSIDEVLEAYPSLKRESTSGARGNSFDTFTFNADVGCASVGSSRLTECRAYF